MTAFRASQTGSGSGASLFVTQPASTQVGDLLIAVFSRWSFLGGTSIAVPSGWDLLPGCPVVGGETVYVFTRKATSAGAITYTFTQIGGTSPWDSVMLAYSNPRSVSPVDTAAVSSTTSANANVAPGVTSTHDDALLLTVWVWGSSGTATVPGSMTERVDFSSNTHIDVADELLGAAGATGTRTATATANSFGDVAISIVLAPANVAPNAPTGLTPSGAVTVDQALAQRLSWAFSDPDSADSPSKFDLQYKLVGAGAWTTVTQTTPNSFCNFAAGALAAGDYEWQVRTYDSLGVVGPWSTSAFFTAGTTPTGPTITSPVSGGTIPSNTALVVWSAPDQTDYEVRTVADASGSPDTSTVYTDTGIVTSSTARSVTVAFSISPRYEHVQVRVKASGLWSSWASIRVLVSYTPPAVPTLTVDPQDAAAAVELSPTQPVPTGGQPPAVSMDVHRRIVGDVDGFRIATGLPPTVPWTDYTPASGVAYEYQVVALAANGTSSASDWVRYPLARYDISRYDEAIYG